jgi:hypothetical protein
MKCIECNSEMTEGKVLDFEGKIRLMAYCTVCGKYSKWLEDDGIKIDEEKFWKEKRNE